MVLHAKNPLWHDDAKEPLFLRVQGVGKYVLAPVLVHSFVHNR